ncbi:MAG: pilin [Candidatus Beckwithbacteria bacterium]
MKKLLLGIFCYLLFYLLSPSSLFAADCRISGCPTPPDTYCESGTWVCTTPPGYIVTGCSGATGYVCTALGDIPTQPAELVKWILKHAIIMGGGIAFLMSVFGGVSIILAGGNPEKINAGKEIITSALTGLLFIVFSVFLLRLIGYDILQLPGFSR